MPPPPLPKTRTIADGNRLSSPPRGRVAVRHNGTLKPFHCFEHKPRLCVRAVQVPRFVRTLPPLPKAPPLLPLPPLLSPPPAPLMTRPAELLLLHRGLFCFPSFRFFLPPIVSATTPFVLFPSPPVASSSSRTRRCSGATPLPATPQRSVLKTRPGPALTIPSTPPAPPSRQHTLGSAQPTLEQGI